MLAAAGIEVDLDNLRATKDYIQEVCEVGSMGYAAFPGQRRHHGDGFGRTGSLGVALYLHNDRPGYTNLVRKSLGVHYANNFYFSHATCVMGKAWGVMAIAGLDPVMFRKMMDQHRNDFELLRLSDGSFVSNPAQKNRHGKQDLVTGGSGERHRWTTAFNALIYAIGQKKLRIAGGVAKSPDRYAQLAPATDQGGTVSLLRNAK